MSLSRRIFLVMMRRISLHRFVEHQNTSRSDSGLYQQQQLLHYLDFTSSPWSPCAFAPDFATLAVRLPFPAAALAFQTFVADNTRPPNIVLLLESHSNGPPPPWRHIYLRKQQRLFLWYPYSCRPCEFGTRHRIYQKSHTILRRI
jgi:hypothetical protein